jgi:uncharacterized membrane protein
LEALERSLLYVEQYSKPTPTDVIFMKRWRDIAASARSSTLYQKKITDFVKKKKRAIYKCASYSILSVFVSVNKIFFLVTFFTSCSEKPKFLISEALLP